MYVLRISWRSLRLHVTYLDNLTVDPLCSHAMYPLLFLRHNRQDIRFGAYRFSPGLPEVMQTSESLRIYKSNSSSWESESLWYACQFSPTIAVSYTSCWWQKNLQRVRCFEFSPSLSHPPSSQEMTKQIWLSDRLRLEPVLLHEYQLSGRPSLQCYYAYYRKTGLSIYFSSKQD